MRSRRSSPRTRTLLITAVALCMSMAQPALSETVVPVAPFQSLTLRNGGRVVLRHGPVQRVTMLEGGDDCTTITIEDGDRLVIDRAGKGCSSRHRQTIEVLTPAITEVEVWDGGMVQSLGGFPAQKELRAAVMSGGMIDLRSLSADAVMAGVRHGGRIFIRPRGSLVASVAHGGAVTYWGKPRVKSSISHGGVVERGAPEDVEKRLQEIGAGPSDEPYVPPVPPVDSH